MWSLHFFQFAVLLCAVSFVSEHHHLNFTCLAIYDTLYFVLCRFRGYVEDGYDFSTDTPNSIRGVKYWQVQTARLAFVIVFEVYDSSRTYI